MFLRTLFSGLVALTLTMSLAATASAQVVDPRVAQLEDQIRQLTGTVEELNFQILQMQDQLRRMQEDNEQRFQELEERRSDAGPASPQDVAPRDHAASQDSSGDDEFYANLPRVQEGAEIRGTPPQDLGSITFDAEGNPIGAVAAPAPAADETTVAALPPGGDADDEIYRNAYQFVLSGDYATAEAGFRDLIARFPDSEHAADAHFWLGESLLGQEKPREAAEIFLAANRNYPQARKAPDMLFKLGVSLASMKQRDLACATFKEVVQRYPNASDALRERLKQEQTAASC
ncbi:tol-pal system protein YbgF [Aquamicrobium zhengzhouense]|uniref:Cell division coordinator CpoB n=1 Tax=Aquamicrobium zhengzhouense TaxID=2781738 RepID=A0ABS0SGA2_9HYPH|nr:tol-pal system protein YbgF [Aquamicrobium zhengzhouense]MBI1622334.1 tol-pal system protein YbgF [Aquamicrobium zhengzhouense]